MLHWHFHYDHLQNTDHKVKNLHNALRQVPDCLAVWPNNSHTHEKSEGSNAGGRGEEGGRDAGANLSLGDEGKA